MQKKKKDDKIKTGNVEGGVERRQKSKIQTEKQCRLFTWETVYSVGSLVGNEDLKNMFKKYWDILG